jgi:hypothetical protein
MYFPSWALNAQIRDSEAQLARPFYASIMASNAPLTTSLRPLLLPCDLCCSLTSTASLMTYTAVCKAGYFCGGKN